MADEYEVYMAEGQRLASERDDLIAQGVDPAELLVPLAPRRPRPMPTLPNPGITSNGKVYCNEPLLDHLGQPVPGHYCQRLVKARHRGREKGAHRGAHRVEWWSS